MGGCCSADREKIDPNRFDLQTIFESYVWRKLYKMNVGACKAFLTLRKNCVIEFRWEYLDRDDETEWNETEPPESQKGGSPVVLHYADYENNTNGPQKFTFSAHRETKSTTSFTLTNSFAIGSKTSIQIKVPGDILSLGTEASGNYTVTNSNTQTFEERLQWDVNSEITVEQGHKAKAEMRVIEKTSSLSFKVTSRFTFLKDKDGNKQKLPFVMKRKSDGKILSVGSILSLEAPFKGLLPPESNFISFEDGGGTMIIKLDGVCKSETWREQHQKVESQPIVAQVLAQDGQ